MFTIKAQFCGVYNYSVLTSNDNYITFKTVKPKDIKNVAIYAFEIISILTLALDKFETKSGKNII